MDPDTYCRQHAAPRGSSLHYALLHLPGDRQRAATALYAFCREVDAVASQCNDPGVARSKLQWWHGEIEHLFDANPQHPVTQALQPAIDHFTLPREYFHEIVDAAEQDLEQVLYPTFRELSLYCHGIAGHLGMMCAEIYGYTDHHTPRFGHDLAIALRLTEILRNVRQDVLRGKLYLPQEDLERFDLRMSDLTHPQTSDRLCELFRFQARRLAEMYRKAFALLPDQDRSRQRPHIVLTRIYQALLAEIEDDGFRLLEHRIELTPLRKLWITWRTLWGERRRRTS